MPKLNDTIELEVTNIKPYGVFLKDKEWNGLCHISNVSDFFVSDLNNIFKLGDKYTFQIIKIDSKTKKLKLSYKAIRPELIKRTKPEPTASGFKNLKAHVDSLLKN